MIPYFEFDAIARLGEKLSMETRLGYSPFVHAKDNDNHILRDKVSTTDTDWDGDAIFGTVAAQYRFFEQWFCAIKLEGMKLSVAGRSDSYSLGAWSHAIDTEITSEQLSALLTIGLSF